MTIVKKTDSYWPALPSLIDNFLSRDWMDWSNLNFSSTNTTLPAVNVRETEDDFLIDVAAPGLTKKDFQINLENNQLTISSEKEQSNDEENYNYARREFSYQSFKRSFNLPEHLVDGDKVSAKYEEGILKIQVPKREEPKPKPARVIKIS
ncbi:MAG: Hsp20/alpha crystallin family protein [Ignavibacteriales bacterium]|nr:Hsp20/alpha crystallin family protein [Ignavibacteriales bacterium]MCF8367544.1 Hsp20/alpha crystallin family protein [Bacteroidales bacterium]MCF8402649.1 Hsp20/alpha crystallin family protein [Bacteroidales bacterium]